MKAVKLTSIVTLVVALIIWGGFYLNNNNTVQRQEANPAQTSTNTSLDTPSDETDEFTAEELDVTSEQPLQSTEDDSQEPNLAQSIPGIQGSSREIISLQQQIEGRMIGCVQIAQNTQARAMALRQRELALEAQREAIVEQIRNIDASTPEGRTRRSALQAQREAIQDQRSVVRNEISTVRRTYGQSRTDCRREINRLRTLRHQAQSAMNRQFSDDISIRFR